MCVARLGLCVLGAPGESGGSTELQGDAKLYTQTHIHSHLLTDLPVYLFSALFQKKILSVRKNLRLATE